MGFFFRKTRSAGPFNFNFSTSGIGVSTGITGARIGVGPQGTTISLGRDGFYYRKRIKNFRGLRAVDWPSNDPFPKTGGAGLPSHLINPDPAFDPLNEALASDTLLVFRFILPLPLFLLSNPNWALLLLAVVAVGGPRYFPGITWADKPSHWKFSTVVGYLMAAIACFRIPFYVLPQIHGFSGTPNDLAFAGVILAGIGLAGVAAINRRFPAGCLAMALAVLACTALTPKAAIAALAFAAVGVLGLIEKNGRCMFLGFSDAENPQDDCNWTKVLPEIFDHNSAVWVTLNGNMMPAWVGEADLPHISTAFQLVSFQTEAMELFFSPTGLILFDRVNTRFLGFDYSIIKFEYKVRCAKTKSTPPSDSPVESVRWEHERMDGGPDRRYSYNPKWITFRMGSIAVTAKDLQFEILMSSPRVAEISCLALKHSIECIRTGKITNFLVPEPARNPQPEPTQPSAPSASRGRTQRPKAPPRPKPPRPPDLKETLLERKVKAMGLFGLTGTWTEKDLTAAYRRLAKDYHPDIHANLPPEFKDLAHRKMSEINEAYEFLSSQDSK